MTLPLSAYVEISYLYVEDDFTEDVPKEPCFSRIPDNRGWETKENDHEVCHGEIEDEKVGNGPHAVVPIDGHADESVPDEAHGEYDEMGCDKEPLDEGREDVCLELGNDVHAGGDVRESGAVDGIISPVLILDRGRVVFIRRVEDSPFRRTRGLRGL